jgi:AraC-like DNA-binding protein
MDYQEFPAPPPFDRLIRCVWYLAGRGDQYVPQPIVPDGRLELLVHLGDPFSRLDRDGSAHIQDALLAAGQLTGPIHLAPGAWIDVVGVRLTPLGAHAILDLPLAQIANQVVSLRQLHPRAARVLEAVATARLGRAERAGRIMTVLSRLVQEPLDERIASALERLSAGSAGSIKTLANHWGWSPRTLERRFLNEVGLTPKMYQRVVRFRRAFQMLGQAGKGTWAQVAIRAGYYDQAHLIRDFRRLAGTPPRDFFGRKPALAQAFTSS